MNFKLSLRPDSVTLSFRTELCFKPELLFCFKRQNKVTHCVKAVQTQYHSVAVEQKMKISFVEWEIIPLLAF